MSAGASAVLLAGGSMIDLDGTFFVQIAVFFIAFFLLRALVFRPMMALFDAREQAIEGARLQARKLEKELASRADEVEEALRKARIEAAAERDRLRREGLRLERVVLERAQQDVQRRLAEASERLEAERATLRRQIEADVPDLARRIAERLLGREVS